jgi:hypothetical protein
VRISWTGIAEQLLKIELKRIRDVYHLIFNSVFLTFCQDFYGGDSRMIGARN